MNIFAVVSSIFLAVILSWSVYHVLILFAGIRNKQKHVLADVKEFPKFSLIVPAKDEEVVIGRCLDSLLNMDYPREKLEIIIVNGDSRDNTQQICEEYSARHFGIVKVVCEKNSHGKPGALNLASFHVSGDIIGVFDADSMPDRTVLRKVASYFQNQSIMALQGRTCAVNEKQNMLTKVAAMEDRAWFQGLLGGREALKLFIPLTGSCQFVRRSILDEVGGWDESSLAEDVELSLKLTKKNYLVTFAPDICSGQEMPSTFRGLFAQRTRWYRGYMEAAFKYGSLLEKINKKTLDAEISLIGPFIMIICLASYINWGLSVAFSVENSFSFFSAFLAVALTSVTLLSLGLSMAFTVKPVRFRSIVWVPFIYGYWMGQMLIATWAFLLILFRRRRVWKKTIKAGYLSQNNSEEQGKI